MSVCRNFWGRIIGVTYSDNYGFAAVDYRVNNCEYHILGIVCIECAGPDGEDEFVREVVTHGCRARFLAWKCLKQLSERRRLRQGSAHELHHHPSLWLDASGGPQTEHDAP